MTPRLMAPFAMVGGVGFEAPPSLYAWTNEERPSGDGIWVRDGHPEVEVGTPQENFSSFPFFLVPDLKSHSSDVSNENTYY